MLELDIPDPEPLPQLFFRRADAAPDQIATRSKVDGRWVPTTWREGRQAVEEIALGLLELGVEAGTPVAIMAATRKEWTEIDLANLCLGAITVGIYPSLTPPQAREILELSEARTVFVERADQQVSLQEACAGLEPPVRCVVMDRAGRGEGVTTLDELRRQGAQRRRRQPEELGRRVGERRAHEVVSYIYTSGTTGAPKGAILTHANFHYVMHATSTLVPYGGERSLVFLPLAHSLQRYASYLGLIQDVDAYYAESLERVPDNLREVKPTVFALVPRVLEKIRARALASGEAATPVRREVFQRSLGILQGVGAARRIHGVPRLRDRLLHRVADQMVAARVRDRLGGRVKFIGSGGAPLSREVHTFFEDLGIPILEGYGLTETSAPVCLNTLGTRRMGTVGRPLPGTEIRVASDGELLVRGPGVFSGYFRDEAETEAAFDPAGWFRTGDIGTISRDGFVTLTDRKKDILVTAGGKNVAPQPLEIALSRHPLVARAVVVGDRRPYLTALVGLDEDRCRQLAEAHGLGDVAPAAIAALPEVRAELDAHLARVNAERPSFAQIKSVEVLPEELTVEAGTLTPTLKVRRAAVQARYAAEIDALYR